MSVNPYMFYGSQVRHGWRFPFLPGAPEGVGPRNGAGDGGWDAGGDPVIWMSADTRNSWGYGGDGTYDITYINYWYIKLMIDNTNLYITDDITISNQLDLPLDPFESIWSIWVCLKMKCKIDHFSMGNMMNMMTNHGCEGVYAVCKQNHFGEKCLGISRQVGFEADLGCVCQKMRSPQVDQLVYLL